MNNFKKNIFKKRTDDIVVPPSGLISGAISAPFVTSSVCSELSSNICFVDSTSSTNLSNGDIVYTDSLGTTPFVGQISRFYRLSVDYFEGLSTYSVVISSSGVVSSLNVCV